MYRIRRDNPNSKYVEGHRGGFLFLFCFFVKIKIPFFTRPKKLFNLVFFIVIHNFTFVFGIKSTKNDIIWQPRPCDNSKLFLWIWMFVNACNSNIFFYKLSSCTWIAYKCMYHLLSRTSLILRKQTTISAIFSGLCGHHFSYFISTFKELEVYFPNIFIDLFVYS